MVELDRGLLVEARRLTKGANVHRLKEMIFAYEQAVDLHTRQRPGHQIYRIKSELVLRRYVLDCKGEAASRVAASAIEAARQASIKSRILADKSDSLQENAIAFLEWCKTPMVTVRKRIA
jgi:hypothetical protein